MKKISMLLSMIALVNVMACSDAKPAEVKKEVIVVPTVVVPTAPVKAPEKNTSVTLDKNGVKLATKKVDVTVNPNK